MEGHFDSTSDEVIGQKKFQISDTDNFFRMGWDVLCTIYVHIERLEGKIRECLFFYVKTF